MTRRPAPDHYLRPNERDWTPAHCIFLDTETRPLGDRDNELHQLRCWAGQAVVRRSRTKTHPLPAFGDGTGRKDLADWVAERVRSQESTWLFTHNLAFDLTVSDLIGFLVDRGWRLGPQWSAHDRAPWFRLTDGAHRVALVDSTTWLPGKLADVAPKVGLSKMSDPAPNDDAGWLERCRSDVAILAAAMSDLMGWWDREKLGNWTVTGNGCGWNLMRHMTPAKVVVIKVDEGARKFERSAIYGGRRDSTRWGRVPGGPFVTVDFEAAYPTLARHVRLPARRMGRFQRLDLDNRELGDGAVQVMAGCRVRTSVPRYPLKSAGSVWYPVGEFDTVLAGPELVDARDRGDLVSIGAGWRYWCDGHLAPWASFVIDLALGRVDGAPPVATLPARRWGRSVLGRFAQRTGEVEHWGPAMSLGWSAQHVSWPAEGTKGLLVDMGGERWLVRQDIEADDSFPAVFAWVESHTRVRLNRMLDAAGEDAWIACNTDGTIVDPARLADRYERRRSTRPGQYDPIKAAAAFCDRVAPSTWPLVPRPKSAASEMWLAGPATMELDGERVMAGLAATATLTGPGEYTGHAWPGLPWQMEHGNRTGYVRPMYSHTVPTVTVNRYAFSDGSTGPVEAAIGPDDTTTLIARSDAAPGRMNGVLAHEQSRAVARLLR